MSGNDNNNSESIPKATGGIAPFGYRWQDGSLVVDETEARVRKLIYELFLKHRRKKTVAKLLNDLGYRTRNEALFSDTTIDRLLRDTTAKGIKIIDGKEVRVEAIISEDIWQSTNNLLSTKATKPAVHLFTGFVFCSCGGKMVVPSQSDKYTCLNCKRKILVTDLEEIVLIKIDEISASEKNNQSLSNYWDIITDKEKRILIENLLEKIIIDTYSIHIGCNYQLHPDDKTPALWQQNPDSNETQNEAQTTQKNEPIPQEPLLNETEAAKFLGISRMTLLRKRADGMIKFYKVGFRVLYSKEKHLIPFLEKHEK